MTNHQNFRPPMSNSPTLHPINSSANIQDSFLKSKGKSDVPHDLELNKNNIVIRPKASKNNQKEKKAESDVDKSASTTANHTQLFNEDSSLKKNEEKKQTNDMNIERHSETNLELPNKLENNLSLSKDSMLNASNQTTSEEIPVAENLHQVEDKSNHEQEQSKPIQNNDSSWKKNIEENQTNDINIEKHSETNLTLPNKQEDNLSLSKDSTSDASSETKDKEIPVAVNHYQVEDKSNHEQEQSKPKGKWESFLSFFQKKD